MLDGLEQVVAFHILSMSWDLGKAMRTKEEFESARLMDFGYRLRARTVRLLARGLGLDAEHWARETAVQADNAILEAFTAEPGKPSTRSSGCIAIAGARPVSH